MLVLSACSADEPTPAPAPNQPTVTKPTASATATATAPAEADSEPADGEPTSTARPSRAPDPTAPATVKPVQRSGKPATRVSAKTRAFDETVRYADDVTLRVTKVATGTTGGKGPGANAGEPKASFTLSLRNGSDRRLDASQVVVALSYGTSKPKLARPVYDETTADFGITLAPGGSATAVYAFSVSNKDLSALRLSVDLDATHGVAIFQGSAR